MTSGTQAQALLSGLCGSPSGSCPLVDALTVCQIKERWASDTAAWTTPQNCDPANPPAPQELRIFRWPQFAYKTWQGSVYYSRNAQGTGFVISGPESAAGGWVADTCPFAFFALGCAAPRFESFDSLRPPQIGGPAWSPEIFSIPGLFDISQISHVSAGQRIFDNTPFVVDVGDPVGVVTGNYYSHDVDLEILGPGGMNLRMVRSYNSRLDYDGPLGHGWTHTFDQHLRIDRGDPNDPGDDHVIWLDENGNETIFEELPDGTLVAPEWSHLQLINTGGSYELRTKAGMLYKFLAESAGRSKLDFIEDRNGNRISCEYEAGGRLARVRDAASNVLTFTHTPSGRLDRIEDWASRRWEYTVHEATGHLMEYRDPQLFADGGASGPAFRFEYYPDHNLRKWSRPAIRGGSADAVFMNFEYYPDDTVFRHTSSNGETTTFFYNLVRRQTVVEHPDGGRESYLFDPFGNVTRHESGRGVVREYEFDGARRNRVGEVDGLGFETTAEYDDRGNMIRRVDRRGKEERWTYNSFSQITSHQDRRGNVQRFEYDAAGNLLRELADIGGAEEVLREHRYDDWGNRVETIDYAEPDRGAPERTRYEFKTIGSVAVGLKRLTDAVGTSNRFTLDALGRPEQARATRTTASGAQQPVVVSTTYDALDRPITITDPVGLLTRTVYDENGLVEQKLREVPASIPGGPTSITDASLEYDRADRLVAATNGLDGATRFAYDAQGRLVETTTPMGRIERREYDEDGNLVAVIDPAGGATRTVYDAEGRVIQVADPIGQQVRSAFDAEGRVTRSWQEFDADTRTLRAFTGATDQRLLMEVLYDEEGNAKRVKDAEGQVVETVYDELGRPIVVRGEYTLQNATNLESDLLEVSDLETGSSSSKYDLQGRLIERKDELTDTTSRATAIGYDRIGRVSHVTDPLQRTTSFRYDEVGNLVERQDPAGKRLLLAYDARRLLTRRHDPDNPGELDDSFRYDAFGRQILAANAEATRTIEYDKLDRPVALFDAGFGTARRVYDADGRTEQTVYPDNATAGFPNGVVTRYEYTPRGELSRVVDPVAGSWSFAYDAAGRPIREVVPNGLERAITYSKGLVIGVESKSGSVAVEFALYSNHDPMGNPGTITTSEGATQVSYDARDRVTNVSYPNGSLTESFSYDRVNNRRTHTRGVVTRSLTVSPADELSSITGDGAPETFGHDPVGRRISRVRAGEPDTSYAYDGLGRLRTVTRGTEVTQIRYDALGTRTRRSDAAGESRYLGEWMEQRGGEKIRLIHGRGIDNVLAEVAAPAAVRHLVPDGRGDVVRTELHPAPRPPNGSFELDSVPGGLPDGWTISGSGPGTWTRDTTRAHAGGTASMKLEVAAADPVFHSKQINATTVTVEPGSYRLSACFYLESLLVPTTPPPGSNLQVVVFDVSNTANFKALFSGAVTGQWDCRALLSNQYFTTSVSLQLGVYVRLNKPGTGTVWVDNVRLVRVDGNEPPAAADAPAPLQIRRYEAFGALRSAVGAMPVERGFAGRPLEGSTGLVYLRARHYDPATGRFLQPDPLGIAADQLYAYARSNPYVYRDPTGLFTSSGPVNNGGGIAALGAVRPLGPPGSSHYLTQDVGPPAFDPRVGRPTIDLPGGIRPPGSHFPTERDAATHGVAHSFDLYRSAPLDVEFSGQIIKLSNDVFTYRVYTVGRRYISPVPPIDRRGVATFHIHTSPVLQNEILRPHDVDELAPIRHSAG